MNDVYVLLWCLVQNATKTEVCKAIKMSIHIFIDVHFKMSSSWQVSEFQAIQFVEMCHNDGKKNIFARMK